MRRWPFIFIALLAALAFGCASEPVTGSASAALGSITCDDLYRVVFIFT